MASNQASRQISNKKVDKLEKEAKNPEEIKPSKQDVDEQVVELKGKKDFFKLRKWWSWAIIAWISTLIAVNTTIVFGIGLKWFDFNGYYRLLNLHSV